MTIPCRSCPGVTNLSHQAGTHPLPARARGKGLGFGFRQGTPQNRLPKGSAPSSGTRDLSPPQDPVLSLIHVCILLGRTWTTFTTARTAGNSTCWTSATWRAGESPAVLPAASQHSSSLCWGSQPALLPTLEAFIGYTLQGCHICSLTLPLTKHSEPCPMGQQLRVQAASLFIFNS